ncbi:hypothetical protein ABK040_004554 [Willaertia magna]
MSATSIFSRPLHLIFVLYFISHIPITIFFDAQPILSPYIPQLYPTAVKEFMRTAWLEPFQDHLMMKLPTWFISFAFCEIFLQLPFFFFAVYAYINCKSWIRIPTIIYSTHVITTMIPILGVFLFDKEMKNHNPITLSVYSIYLVLPLLILIDAVVNGPFNVKNKVKQI